MKCEKYHKYPHRLHPQVRQVAVQAAWPAGHPPLALLQPAAQEYRRELHQILLHQGHPPASLPADDDVLMSPLLICGGRPPSVISGRSCPYVTVKAEDGHCHLSAEEEVHMSPSLIRGRRSTSLISRRWCPYVTVTVTAEDDHRHLSFSFQTDEKLEQARTILTQWREESD